MYILSLQLLLLFSFWAVCYGLDNRQMGNDTSDIGCQHKSTFGRDYRGKVNITVNGTVCQKWSDSTHDLTYLGDNNYCRNPSIYPSSELWCYTDHPDHRSQYCSVPICPQLKALDFSSDNDWNPDMWANYTHATLKKKEMPSSFTICTSFMVDNWPLENSAFLFLLRDDSGEIWNYVQLYAPAGNHTEFEIFLSGHTFQRNLPHIFFPVQWTRVCFSFNKSLSEVSLFIDGVQLVVSKVCDVKSQPSNLHIELGWDGFHEEYPGKISRLNIFSSALGSERMVKETTAGSDECGSRGNFLDWEESVTKEMWTLYSEANFTELDSGLEDPCLMKAKMQIFPMFGYSHHSECMEHCQKYEGRSPPVRTKKEWEHIFKEVRAISPDPRNLLPRSWLSATEGDIGHSLGVLDHWPEGVIAKEETWRDFYYGTELDNFTKPWISSKGDKNNGVEHNCLKFRPHYPEHQSWYEFQCVGFNTGCICEYEDPPILHLRGFCSGTLVEHERYAVMQLPNDPQKIVMIGYQSARIEHDQSHDQWVLRDSRQNITARTQAGQLSFALGKHNWTISGDRYHCSGGRDYTIEMKLTGCKDGKFTCNNGQCVAMEERCDQVPQCRDHSDEHNCRIVVIQRGYNKEVAPIKISEKKLIKDGQFPVTIDLTLQKVVAIEEENHSISFKFKISLVWRENRVTYHNLKTNSDANRLEEDDIKKLWLPRIVYWNTNQEETTRLGENWEWKTMISVLREGNLTRSSVVEIDEAEIFKGAENSLKMEQTYTHAFQCVYKLSRYPFDTQVY